MKRASWIVGVATLVAGGGALPFLHVTRGVAAAFVVAVVGADAALLTLLETLTGKPKVHVEYRNTSNEHSTQFHVIVVNDTRHAAENVEVRFDTLGGRVWNESGNSVGDDIDVTINPPRFVGRGRVLPPQGSWVIALLAWHGDPRHPTNDTARWSASVGNGRSTHGVATLTYT